MVYFISLKYPLKGQRKMKPIEKTMWAYWDDKRHLFFHVYHQEGVVRMCSPDRFQKDEREGNGKVMKVKVTQLT